MKKLILTVTLLASSAALANVYCGAPPAPPPGCHYVCYCDEWGQNCRWVAVCP